MSTVDGVELSDEERRVYADLRQAFKVADAAQVRELVGSHPRLLNIAGRGWGAALALAVAFDERELAEWLIDQGALVDPPCVNPIQLPIAVAVLYGRLEFATWLASKGAALDRVLGDVEANAILWDRRARGADRSDCSDFVLAAYSRIQNPEKGLADALRSALHWGPDDLPERVLDTAAELGVAWTAEHGDALARAFFRSEECVRALLDRGLRFSADVLPSLRMSRQLWKSALAGGDDWRLPLILEAGFDIPAWERTFGSLLVGILDDAPDSSAREVALMLENGLDPNLVSSETANRSSRSGEEGQPVTPLFDALCNRRVDIYRLLIRKGADIGNPTNLALPFFSAAGIFLLDAEEQKALIDAGHDINSLGRWRGSVLHCAARAEYDVGKSIDETTIERLVGFGARFDLCDQYGATPLHAAIDHDKTMARIFVEQGADPQLKNDDGQTALDYASAQPGNKRLVKMMQSRLAERGVAVETSRVKLNYEEPWTVALRDAFDALGAPEQKAWQELLLLATETHSTRPGKTFLKKALEHIEATGRDGVRAGLLKALPAYKEKIPRPADCEPDWHNPWSTTERNVRALRGLLWSCTHFVDDEVSAMLREVAAAAFKKVPGVGMRSAKVGNAALNSLAAMGHIGLRQLAILREQTKYNPAKVNIERVLSRVAKDFDISSDELAEMSTSDFGLSECGRSVQEFGEYRAELSVPGAGRTELVWYKGEKAQKTVPAAVKRDFASELKLLKVLSKDLQQATLAVRNRLEKQYLEPTTWDLDTWRERYLDHPVAGVLARRLVWRMRSGKGAWKSVLWSERKGAGKSEFIDVEGAPVATQADTQVELWHPLHDKTRTVLAWRERLAEEGVVQPFKQAHREIYVVTDAERATADHSLRFADQILRQSQVHALAEQRSWKQTRGGSWDGGDGTDVYRSLPSAKLSVVYETGPMDGLGHSDYGIYLYLTGGPVRFYAERGEREERLAIAEVPDLIFSEIMRDIDLFVSVANAANDPEWEHRARVRDWDERLVEDLRASGETRRDTLEALIPKLKIADRLELDGRFLNVRGDIMTYRIHLGSANVLMEDGRYLCIVKQRDRSKGIALPYEGDSKLSEILSKALLLAADKKIKDEVILEQLRRD